MTTIGAVAAELGLSVEALRYYERAGLSAPVRDGGGRRDYSEFDVDQLRLVTRLRAVGIPIESIRQLLSAKVRDAPAAQTPSGRWIGWQRWTPSCSAARRRSGLRGG